MEPDRAVLTRPFLVQNDPMGAPGFALPAGTVTFLLTDIEGSTLLWEQGEHDMAAAVARHYELLDDAIAAHGGVRPVEQGEGDSVVAAFSRAADAVSAAVEAQRRLVEELPWLPVRMALHTGEAEQRDEGNYVGRTIIRCARLRGCAHGGQILVSESTRSLLRDDGPADTEVLDLGEAYLRNLGRAERVWQVLHPALRRAFPPLRSLEVVRHNLPAPVTSFVGRQRERAVLDGLLAEHRLVTVTGSGGAGKTRLAIEVATAAVDRHPGGTWWVELAPVASASQVGERLVAGLGLAVVAGVDPVEQAARHLAGAGSTLVVLDNAEHVLDAVAVVVDRLLAVGPQVHLLVTSREPVGVPGEVTWRVPSLATPALGDTTAPSTPASLRAYDAVVLFIERARAVRPNLVVDERTAPLLAEICARLDGIPLAIELAAARVRTMSLERIAGGLMDAFRLLTGGARTVLPRQQTLLASIAWSVDVLEPAERAVFHRLAVFRAPFTLDVAEAVAADGDAVDPVAVLDLVTRLVDKSLVQFHEDTGRYSLLETLRQFGLDRLREVGELAAVRTRHACWYARWAADVGRGVHGISGAVIGADLTDAMAALEWAYDADPAAALGICAGLSSFRTWRGIAGVARQCDWLVAYEDRGPAWAAAVAGTSAPALVIRHGGLLSLVPEARAALDPDDRVSRRALDLIDLYGPWLNGDTSGLVRPIEEAVEDGDDNFVIDGLGLCVMAAVRCGRLDETHRRLAQLQAVLDRHGVDMVDSSGAGQLVTVELATVEGRLDDAQRLLRRRLASDGSWATLGFAAQRAYVGHLLGRDDLIAEAEEAALLPGPPTTAGLGRHVRAFAATRRGAVEEAADEALAGWRAVRGLGMIDMFAPQVACALLAAGRLDGAREHLAVWSAAVESFGSPPLPEASCRLWMALVRRAAGDDWLDAAHGLLELAHAHGFRLLRVDALELVADALAARGDWASAARVLGAATSERTRTGYVGHWRPDPEATARSHAAVAEAQPSAFDEGRSMETADVVEWVRRTRGDRGRPSHGWDGLTPTERRVAELVGEGLPNAEIAGRLLMGVTTVKTHLTHVFAKLGVTNRTELAAEVIRRRTAP